MKQIESLGLAVSGIAHDFNNLLQGILGNISVARRRLRPNDAAQRPLEDAENVCKSAYRLTTQLLTFARGGGPVKKTFDIGIALKDWTRFILRESHIAYVLQVLDGPCPIDADEAQIRQVMQWIIINAREAMPGGGTITVRAEKAYLEEEGSLHLSKGRYVRISVTDKGIGMPGENLARFFGPCFSTKNIGDQKGSGLGLAICHSIIKKHQGHITVESERGKEIALTIYLPLFEKSPGTSGVTDAWRFSATGRGRVLFMDDERDVSDLAEAYLEYRGYEVVVTREGGETVRVFLEALRRGRPFDVVVLDSIIPNGKGGVEAVRELLSKAPGVKAVVSSGYPDAAAVTDYRAFGFQEALIKPYDMKTLEKVLIRLISGGSS